MKKVTSMDVAHLAGVSQATVSMILNNRVGASFSEETRNKVLDAARQLGYRLHTQSMPDNDQNLIAVITPTLSNPFYTQLTASIEKYALSQGYKVLICNTSRDKAHEAYYLDYFSKINVAGIIFTFVPSYPQLVEHLSMSLPIVLIGEKTKDLTIPSVELSNVKTGIMIAEHLLSLGHRKFAFLSTPFNNLSLAREQRLEGIKKVLKENHLENNLDILINDTITESDKSSTPYEYEVGYTLTQRYLAKEGGATALIGVNDMTSLGIIGALIQSGMRVPEDYSVCGFDNIFVSSVSLPAITTVDHHLHLRSQSAVDMIISKQNSSTNTLPHYLASQVNKIEYEPLLIARSSTGPLK